MLGGPSISSRGPRYVSVRLILYKMLYLCKEIYSRFVVFLCIRILRNAGIPAGFSDADKSAGFYKW